MSMEYSENLKKLIGKCQETWLVTGAAGFIGSHIAEALLRNLQRVHILDNFSSGKRENIDYLRNIQKQFGGELNFFEGDISRPNEITPAMTGVTKIIHQAALGSVPRSIENPSDSHSANVTGFINILNAAKEFGVRRVVYASSSSVYGDAPGLPKFEDVVGKVLSPYAATKMCDEIYADSYVACYDIELVGLRYFNVFGARQDPNGPYAAVIPKWIDAVQHGIPCVINGDGETSRDFCYIDNVVYANIASALVPKLEKPHMVFNVACGEKTTLNELYDLISANVKALGYAQEILKPEYAEFRIGDVRHSLADISRAKNAIGYQAFVSVKDGMKKTVEAYYSIK